MSETYLANIFLPGHGGHLRGCPSAVQDRIEPGRAEKGSGIFSWHSGLESDPSGFDGRRFHELANGIEERPNLSVITVRGSAKAFGNFLVLPHFDVPNWNFKSLNSTHTAMGSGLQYGLS